MLRGGSFLAIFGRIGTVATLKGFFFVGGDIPSIGEESVPHHVGGKYLSDISKGGYV